MRHSALFVALLFPGLTWAQAQTSCWIQDAASPGNGKIALLCDHDTVLLSEGSKPNWRAVKLPVPGKLRAIAFADAKRGFIVGDAGVLLATEDAGLTWRQTPEVTHETLTSIFFLGNEAWLAGYGGVIFHSNDGGRSWERQPSGASISLESIYFSDKDYGWAVGWGGAMIRTTDGGKTWTPVKVADALWSLNSVYFLGRQTGWITGMFGLILHTKDGGATWTTQTSPVNASLTSVHFDQTGRGWMIAENDILTSRDKGETWVKDWRGQFLFLQKFVYTGEKLWAVGPFGAVAYDGKAWKDMDVFKGAS